MFTNGSREISTSDRRDTRLTPRVSLNFLNLLNAGWMDGSLYYSYDENDSNDRDKEFENHIVGMSVSFHF